MQDDQWEDPHLDHTVAYNNALMRSSNGIPPLLQFMQSFMTNIHHQVLWGHARNILDSDSNRYQHLGLGTGGDDDGGGDDDLAITLDNHPYMFVQLAEMLPSAAQVTHHAADTCSICWEQSSVCRIVGCTHEFCAECMLQLRGRTPRCPMCRNEFVAVDVVVQVVVGPVVVVTSE